ncbi:hypothetical protein BDZ90DRAFT_234473 [Jaminaea rosea]|uniref:K Homology domain-containing protein n=1 Tax=Jaminaea rosea TaxID=1569628 RepID=A0A316UHP2_9BASI|nr:hypothetical protein BDZ90DRAFT_234473 [Jaminaea rosea]PWN24857.1 hypothetical protein BDZ90DRAFT_234473 [Jaminaea rosea]
MSSPSPTPDIPASSPSPSAAASPTQTQTLSLRALLSTKEAGVIIGKGGSNVASLRESTGVKAGVSKVVQGVHDRVLSVTGSLEGCAKAFGLIAKCIAENPVVVGVPAQQQQQQQAQSQAQDADGDAEGEGVASPSAAVSPLIAVRLLISHNLMGTIIGRQGLKIKHIQDISGARMVASKDMLPQSTERIVEVQGSAQGIEVAVREIGKCLVEDWERGQGTILYHPGSTEGAGILAAGGAGGLHPQTGSSTSPSSTSVKGAGAGAGAAGYLAGTMGGLSLAANAAGARRASNNHHRNNGANGSAAAVAAAAAVVTPGGALNVPSTDLAGATSGSPSSTSPSMSGMPPALVDASSPPAPAGSSSAATSGSVLRTQNISIPADMVGCIIGKGGSKITEIRRLSGSRISIAKVAHDESGERMFTIQGSREGNEKALFLLYTQLESEKERRTQTENENNDNANANKESDNLAGAGPGPGPAAGEVAENA